MHLVYLWKILEKTSDHLPNSLITENLNTQLKFKLKPLKICFTQFKKENLLRDKLKQMEKIEHVKYYN